MTRHLLVTGALAAGLALQLAGWTPALAQIGGAENNNDNDAIGSCNDVEFRSVLFELADVQNAELREAIEDLLDRATVLQNTGQLIRCGELLTEARQRLEQPATPGLGGQRPG